MYKIVHLKVTPELHQAIKLQAFKDGVTMQAYMVNWLEASIPGQTRNTPLRPPVVILPKDPEQPFTPEQEARSPFEMVKAPGDRPKGETGISSIHWDAKGKKTYRKDGKVIKTPAQAKKAVKDITPHTNFLDRKSSRLK